jgi:outer membrane protein assembly factor BamC
MQQTRKPATTRYLTGAALALLTVLAGCSSLEPGRVDYKSSTRGNTLDVPPDLTQLARDTRYNLPGGTVTASGMAAAQPNASVPVAAAAVGDARIDRAGNQRWLVVKRDPAQVWPTVREFWQDNGFVLTIDQTDIGIMETDWAENRAKIPQDFIRSTIGKALDSLYSTGERDRFRTRLERNANGETEIFISHRRMQEVYTNADKGSTVWTPTPADPELEAEFLRKLMVRLGVREEIAKAQAPAAGKNSSRIGNVDGRPVVLVDEGFDRAWRRVGLSLDRTGFTVEDRDRSKGMYFVRYVEPSADKSEPGFLGRLFGSKPKEAPAVKYRISLQSQGDATTVAVLNAQGSPETSDNAQRIVKVLADDLR